MRYLLALLLCFLSIIPARAADVMDGPIKAQVVRVLDGDTFDVRAQIWVGQFIETRIRLNGLDTPELRGKYLKEKALAKEAREALIQLIQEQPVLLTRVEYGKFAGRVLAEAQTQDGRDISQYMIDQGHARPYDGGTRSGWCGMEMAAKN